GDAGSPTVVSVGGLARSDSGNFSAEFAEVLERLAAAGPPVNEAYGTTSRITRDDPIGAGKD
ncbi:MAG: hypothetical protein QOI15_713, partial [Pseudonocardiales bacterium]|nr:hypothetical protein [Pseudonocardiales bacterium]